MVVLNKYGVILIQDEDGNSGWMLVAHFDEFQLWGGKGVNVNTTTGDIHMHSGYGVSANFYNDEMRRFRITLVLMLITELILDLL